MHFKISSISSRGVLEWLTIQILSQKSYKQTHLKNSLSIIRKSVVEDGHGYTLYHANYRNDGNMWIS